MLRVEDWAEVRRFHRAEGMSISQIAQALGISRNTTELGARDRVQLVVMAQQAGLTT